MEARMSRQTRIDLLAVASGGGHWVQLRRLALAWRGLRFVYASVAPPEHGLEAGMRPLRHYVLRDATRWDRWALLVLAWQLAGIVWHERPKVIMTTGAAPGLLAILWGRVSGAHTIWIDSLANVDRLSGAGRLAMYLAHECLTQWPHLAKVGGPVYKGSVW
jgi:hypothetical protein